jgi:hypothetical protein
LDDILSSKASMDNYDQMLIEGLNPIPCFHYGETFDVLDFYLRKTDYIAIGGIATAEVRRNKKGRAMWLDKVFNRYPNVKFHGFGVQQPFIMLRYPWFSIDSTAAGVLSRYGELITPWGIIRITLKGRQFVGWKSPVSQSVIADYLQEMGIDYSSCELSDSVGALYRLKANIIYYERLAAEEFCDRSIKRIKGFSED